MIRLTRQADYGILLLVQVASEPAGSVQAAPDLAAATGIPVPMVSKILKTLARAGLLVSHRGPHGGYHLASSPADISLANVIEALDGPIAMTACTGGDHDCSLETRCCVQPHWQHVNRAVVEALSRVSLADIAKPGDSRLVSIEAGDRTLSFPAQ